MNFLRILPSADIQFLHLLTMYLRKDNAEPNVEVLQDFIRSNPLGILISSIHSPNFPALQCTHIPWVLDSVSQDDDANSLGALRAHMARANPHTKALIESALGSPNGILEDEITILFNGPAHSYITPKWYVETKPSTGKVVPTWNYAAVQVYGIARIIHDSKDPETGAFLQKAVEDLSRESEETMIERSEALDGQRPWTVRDAPEKYVDLLKKAIVGIEVRITRIEGKWKMSQEMGVKDREGVAKGLRAVGDEDAHDVATMVEDRGRMKDAKRTA